MMKTGKTQPVRESGGGLWVSCICNSPKTCLKAVKLKIVWPEPGQNCGMGDCISPIHRNKNKPPLSTFWKD